MELGDDIKILKDLVIRLLKRVEELEFENAALRADVADLRSKLNQNSKNSHKPPSSDGLSKKPALPKEPAKKSGGQFGHPGKTLKMVEQPDHVVVHHASYCPCCQRVFSSADVQWVESKRQVFDLPAPRLEVTEHQVGVIVCCGRQHPGVFPAAVSQPVQYGSRIRALSVLLNTDYKLPLEKIEQLMGDLWGCTFNESTALSANKACYEKLELVEMILKSNVKASKSANFDETGMRVSGKLHWFHTASTGLFTYLFVHTHRGREALESEASLIKDYQGWAVHDCWESYFGFADCSHALCNAHLLRELEALRQQKSKWAAQMHGFLLELYRASHKATQIVADKQRWLDRYRLICQMADAEEPPPMQGKRGKPKKTKGRNLLQRLIKHQDAVLAFAFHQEVPFTNNQAERDIRCLKTKQKVATSFRTFNGAQQYARIQSYVSTLRKHSMNVWQNLIDVFDNNTIVFQNA